MSYLPATDAPAAQNGYTAAAFASKKRMHLEKVNGYADASVGRPDDAQRAAFAKTLTTLVRTVPEKTVGLVNNNDRPSIIITEISADQYGGDSTLAAYKTSPNSDPFECFEMYNNAKEAVNIFDYMIGYQGSGATSVSTWFERPSGEPRICRRRDSSRRDLCRMVL